MRYRNPAGVVVDLDEKGVQRLTELKQMDGFIRLPDLPDTPKMKAARDRKAAAAKAAENQSGEGAQ